MGPRRGDPRFDAWDEQDSTIITWLLNLLTLEISDTCMFLTTAKDIQDEIHQTYSKTLDATQVYKIKVKTEVGKQGNKTIIKYANMLNNLWQELDHYQCIKTKCPENATILKNYIEEDRVYNFLVGLNAKFD